MAFCLLNLGGLETHEYLLPPPQRRVGAEQTENSFSALAEEETTTDVNNGLTIDFQRNSVRDLCKTFQLHGRYILV